jgi:regulator of sirC expression with transglutaminase-like and TPR domain
VLPAEKEKALELFREAVGAAEERIDLVEGALLLAQSEYPHLDRSAYRRRLEEMGREAREACGGAPGMHTGARLEKLSRLFSGGWGFRGNRDDYYDPRNGFLNDVLDRRTGIPITLALVYIEVGRRAGIELLGIGMPGHFLVGCADRSDLFVDAFSEGALLTRADCAARLRELRPDVAFRPEFLEPVGPRQILTRMLNNLLEIYLHTERYSKALSSLEMILCLQPAEPEWLRRRALVHYQLKNYPRAIADLESYLERAPEAADRDALVQQLTLLRHLRSRVN